MSNDPPIKEITFGTILGQKQENSFVIKYLDVFKTKKSALTIKMFFSIPMRIG